MGNSIKIYRGTDKIDGELSLFAVTSCGKIGVTFYEADSKWLGAWSYEEMMSKLFFSPFKELSIICSNPELIMEISE